MPNIKFYQDLSTNRPAATTAYDGALFFAIDTREIQLCDGGEWVPYGGKVKFVDSLPSSGTALSDAEQGILYIDVSGAAGFSTGDPATWVSVSSGALTKDRTVPTTNPSEVNVPTTAAVRTAIDAAVANVPTLINGQLDPGVIPSYALSELIPGTYANLSAVVTAFSGSNPPDADHGDYVVTEDGILYLFSSGDGDATSDWTPVATPNTYTGANGVSITGTVISGTTYAKGDGISITGANNTVAVDLDSSTGLAIDSSTKKLKGVVATTSAMGMMSSTDKTKLDGLSNYVLPKASVQGATGAAIGGVMVDGESVSIDPASGTISIQWKTFTNP